MGMSSLWMYQTSRGRMKDKKIVDKDGVQFTPDEVAEYENDVWDLRFVDQNPTVKKAANLKMWNKWGKRLGLPHPDDK